MKNYRVGTLLRLALLMLMATVLGASAWASPIVVQPGSAVMYK